MSFLYLLMSCFRNDIELPPSQLKDPPAIKLVQYGKLKGYLYKPTNVNEAIIFLTSKPIFDVKTCFLEQIDEQKVAFLATKDQSEIAIAYIKKMLSEAKLEQMELQCQ